MQFRELAAARFSVRQFKDRPVGKDKVDMILEAARIAPTAANRQPQRILVVSEAEGLAKVDACTPYRFAAPLVFIICYDKNECWVRSFDGAHSGEVDASIITTQMMLQAADIGLGTTWVMYFDPARTREEFALPANIIPLAFLPTGYPADDAEPASYHSLRHPLDRLLL
ncbi:MAG: nitroreductase family protein [Treponema sp.]|jgi:nitroreductase|nr:nitroreductase family protein [Treponema sp.]